jgi:hypothetical protein
VGGHQDHASDDHAERGRSGTTAAARHGRHVLQPTCLPLAEKYSMLLFLVKAFSSVIWNLTSVGFAEGRTRQGWAAPGGRAGSY